MTQSQHVIEELYDCYTKTAANITYYYDNTEMKQKLQELREIVKNNCIQNEKLRKSEDMRNELLNLYDEQAETDIESILSDYKKAISEISINVSKDRKLLEFDKQVEGLVEGKGGNDGNDGDGDLQLTGGLINVIDPISKKRIVDPVKNTVCGHTYDRASITELLQIQKKTRCPIIGCTTTDFVSLANLKTDIVVKTYLDKNPV